MQLQNAHEGIELYDSYMYDIRAEIPLKAWNYGMHTNSPRNKQNPRNKQGRFFENSVLSGLSNSGTGAGIVTAGVYIVYIVAVDTRYIAVL